MGRAKPHLLPKECHRQLGPEVWNLDIDKSRDNSPSHSFTAEPAESR